MPVFDVLAGGHHYHHHHAHPSSFNEALVEVQEQQAMYNQNYKTGTSARQGIPMDAVFLIPGNYMTNEQFMNNMIPDLKMKALAFSFLPANAQDVYASVAAIGACAHKNSNCQGIGEVTAMTLGASAPVKNFAAMAPTVFKSIKYLTMGKVERVAYLSGGSGKLGPDIRKAFTDGTKVILEYMSAKSPTDLLDKKMELSKMDLGSGAAANAARKGQIDNFNDIYVRFYNEANGGMSFLNLGPMNAYAKTYQLAANGLIKNIGDDINTITGAIAGDVQERVINIKILHFFLPKCCFLLIFNGFSLQILFLYRNLNFVF